MHLCCLLVYTLGGGRIAVMGRPVACAASRHAAHHVRDAASSRLRVLHQQAGLPAPQGVEHAESSHRFAIAPPIAIEAYSPLAFILAIGLVSQVHVAEGEGEEGGKSDGEPSCVPVEPYGFIFDCDDRDPTQVMCETLALQSNHWCSIRSNNWNVHVNFMSYR